MTSIQSQPQPMVRFAAQQPNGDPSTQRTDCWPTGSQPPADKPPVKPLEEFLTDLAMKPAEEVAEKLNIGLKAAEALKAEAQAGWPTLKSATNAADLLSNSQNVLKLLSKRTGGLLGGVLGKLGQLTGQQDAPWCFPNKPEKPEEQPPADAPGDAVNPPEENSN